MVDQNTSHEGFDDRKCDMMMIDLCGSSEIKVEKDIKQVGIKIITLGHKWMK
jgi:hypothetical protein